MDVLRRGAGPLPDAVPLDPPSPQRWELRVVVWEAASVAGTERQLLSGDRSSDVYVKVGAVLTLVIFNFPPLEVHSAVTICYFEPPAVTPVTCNALRAGCPVWSGRPRRRTCTSRA